ncbi:MAG: hypothetical protein Q8N61_03165 [bacterium]|nr:hypothetical protein [bacterium]
MLKLTYKIMIPRMPAPAGLVKKIMLKKEAQTKTFAKIKATKRDCLLSLNMQELYQNFKIKAKVDFLANIGII